MSKPFSPVNAAISAAPFVRTLLGDLPATNELGVCDSHEHVAIRGPWLAERFPEFVLADLDHTLVDLRAFRAAGGGWIVDSMPTGAGRDVLPLAEASRRSGVPLVCPTGVHQSKYYPPDHALLALDRDRLAELFVREITVGLDDGAGTLDLRAGVIKVATSGPQWTNRDREVFVAAAVAQRQTGCPILTHTEAGRDAMEQVDCLCDHGASPSQIVLSHCDKNYDESYHRELLHAGVCLEYDQHFRQVRRGERCASVELIATLADDFPQQLLVGMDMARQCYWTGYGGEPGLAWLLTGLVPRLRQAGVSEDQIARILVENPVRAYAFRPPRLEPEVHE